MMVIPSSIVESMGPAGVMGTAALAQQAAQQQASEGAAAAPPALPPGAAPDPGSGLAPLPGVDLRVFGG